MCDFVGGSDASHVKESVVTVKRESSTDLEEQDRGVMENSISLSVSRADIRPASGQDA